MRPYFHSLGYALAGLKTAFRSERNLKLFIALYVISLLMGWYFGIEKTEWIILIFSGAVFLAVELINTAIEHFSDAFDDHSKAQDDIHEQAIKATKDIAAAGALMVATAWGVTVLFVFLPRLHELIA